MIKVFKEGAKTDQAYKKLHNEFVKVIEEFQLDYFECFGILEAMKADLLKSNIEEDD